MFKYDVNYTDFDGNECEETLYFNLSTMEYIDIESEYPGGLEGVTKELMAKGDLKAMMIIFVKLIKLSFGEKSPDGKRFIKDKERSEEFLESNTFNEFFNAMLADGDGPDSLATRFIRGIAPNTARIMDAGNRNTKN